MNDKPRYHYRFSQFTKAYHLLEDAVKNIQNLNRLEKEGLIQRFEYSFELAWKLLKDYLDDQGISVTSPRQTIKTAFSQGIIKDGDSWIVMLESRNLLSHTYNEEQFEKSVEMINTEFYPNLSNLKTTFENKLL